MLGFGFAMISLAVAGLHAARGDPASATDPCLSGPSGNACPVWTQTFSQPGGENTQCMGLNVPQGAAVGPSGVYVTGYSCDSNDHGIPGNDIFTVANDPTTGARLWVARYNGPGAPGDAIGDVGSSVAVSPSGDRVYVTGSQNGGLGSGPSGDFRFVSDYVTIAYDASTGAELWNASYHGPAVGPDAAEQVAVSEDGLRVFVTGESQAPDVNGKAAGTEVATLAYDAKTGAQEWVFRYHAPVGGPSAGDRNNAIGVTSIAVHGSRVYTSGAYLSPSVGAGYEIIALEDDRGAGEGRLLWAATSDPTVGYHLARDSLAVTPSAVLLTGTASSQVAPPATCPPQQTSGAASSQYDTVALDPDTGALRWTAMYAGQAGGNNAAFSLAASPRGDRLYVTGQASSAAPSCALGFTTLAYDTATGREEWRASEAVPPGIAPQAFALAASPDGTRVYVAGLEYHVETLGEKGDSRLIAYDAASGASQWSGRYNTGTYAGTTDLDLPYLVRVSPDGDRVFVAEKADRNIQYDVDHTRFAFATLAYETSHAPRHAAHAPIYIDGANSLHGFVVRDPTTGNVDWNLTRLKTGVVAGSGTLADPYVIEGWTIDPDAASLTTGDEPYGIGIQNTRAHFIVRDTDVTGMAAHVMAAVPSRPQFRGGIHLLNVENGTFENIEVNDSYSGIKLDHSAHNLIENCTSHDNGVLNVPLADPFGASGLELSSSSNNRIVDCASFDNANQGLALESSDGNEIVNFTAYGNVGNGLYASGVTHTLVSGCVAHDNGNAGAQKSAGVLLSGSNDTVMVCDAYANGAVGISVSGPDVTLERCTARDNPIGLALGSNVRVTDCEIRENTLAGIALTGKTVGDTLTRNVVRSNGIGLRLRQSTDGLHSTPDGNLVYDNAFLDNAEQYSRDYPALADNNVYNVSKTLGRNIMRGPFIGGNFWSDYGGEDLDGDGLGDTLVPWGPGDALPIFAPNGPLDHAPAAPSGPTPADGAIHASARPDLTWDASVDPDKDAVFYDVFFGTDAVPPRVVEGSSTTSFEPGRLALSTTYHWQVVARDALGLANASANWSFTTRAAGEDVAPDAPADAGPANGAAGVATSPTLAVHVSDPDADLMDVSFYGRAQGSGGAFLLVGRETSVTSGSTASTTWAYLPYATTFEWYSVANDSEKETTSPTWTFTTQDPPLMDKIPIRAPHPVISIRSDADFTAANGVTSGTGTLEDPYVIEGWDIDGQAGAGVVGVGAVAGDSIRIRDTSAPFIVRNVYVHDGTYDGIVLTNVANALLDHVVAANTGVGMAVSGTQVLVRDCDVSATGWAIGVSGSHEVTVRGCDLHANARDGIDVSESPGTVLEGNLITNDPQSGISVSGSPFTKLRNNTLTGSPFRFHSGDFRDPLDLELDIDASNTVDGKPVFYAAHRDGLVLDQKIDGKYAFVAVVSSRDVVLRNVTLDVPVFLANLTDATVSGCDLHAPGLSDALEVYLSKGVSIRDCSFHDSVNGVVLDDTTGSRLENVHGYDLLNDAFWFIGSDGNTLTHCSGTLKDGGADSPRGALVPAAIYLKDSSGNVVEGCTAHDSLFGLLVLGASHDNHLDNETMTDGSPIFVTSGASRNTISDCRLTHVGIYLDVGADDTTITGCVIQDATRRLGFDGRARAGIQIDESTGAVLRGNSLVDSIFAVDGWHAAVGDLVNWRESDFHHDVDPSNTIDGKPILYLVDKHDIAIDAARTPVGYLGVVSSSNVTIENYRLNVGGSGLVLVNTTDSLVEGCRVSNVRGAGVALLFGSHADTVRDCVVRDSGFGVLLHGNVHDNVLAGVTATASASDGFYVSLASRNVLDGCVASRGSGVGVDLADSDSNRVSDCAAVGNRGNGFVVEGDPSDRNVLSDCASRDNGQYGIVIGPGGIWIPTASVTGGPAGNVVSGCTLGNNVARNVHVGVGSRDTVVRGNDFLGVSSTSVLNAVEVPAQGWSDGTNTTWNGNYWSDYHGVDANGDGVGDTPYVTYGGQDKAPAMDVIPRIGPQPFAWFISMMHGHQTFEFTDRSFSPDGNIASWSWDFGDGNVSTEQDPIHRFATSGVFTVRLAVADYEGRTANVTVSLAVAPNRAPVLAPIATENGAEASPLAFTVTAMDPDSDLLTLSATGLPRAATFTGDFGLFSWTPDYDQAGTYAVTFHASDGDITSSETVSLVIANTDRPPVASFAAPSVVRMNAAVGFTSTSTDPDHEALTYSWQFGDGSRSTLTNPTHAFDVPGMVTVDLTVTDPEGATASAARPLLVDGTPPLTLATLSGPHTSDGWYDESVKVALSATDEGAGVNATKDGIDAGPTKIYGSPFGLPSGEASHVVNFRSDDKVGNVEATKSVTVKVDTVAPSTHLDLQRPLAVIVTPTNLTANVSDAGSGVDHVDFLVDQVVVCTDRDGSDGWSCPWRPDVTFAGRHAIAVFAYDRLGHKGTDSVNVLVVPSPVDLGQVPTVPSALGPGSLVPSHPPCLAGVDCGPGVSPARPVWVCSTANGILEFGFVDQVLALVPDGSTLLKTFRAIETPVCAATLP